MFALIVIPNRMVRLVKGNDVPPHVPRPATSLNRVIKLFKRVGPFEDEVFPLIGAKDPYPFNGGNGKSRCNDVGSR